MLPRARSIFHLGEEGGEEAQRSVASIRGAPESLVGLRILIQQHHGQGSNIVVKSAMKPCRPVARARRSPSNVTELYGFLKTCSLCKKELSLQKEVYMYRGDQGFCSTECRCRQILLDERREFEASTRERLGAPHRRSTGPKIREADNRRRISVAG